MSEQDDKANPIDQISPLLVDCWTSTVGQAADSVSRMKSRPDDAADLKAWRRKWFDSLSQTTEAYLRSPAFLQMLKTHVNTLVAAKHASDSQRKTPSASDGQLSADIQAMRGRLVQLQKQLELLEESSSQLCETASPQPSGDTSESGATAEETMKGATPYEVVFQQGIVRLLRYPNHSVTFAEPILICFALVNRPYILDLQEDRSVVRRLLDRGFDVYLIDWGVPGDSDHTLSLEDYICSFLGNLIQLACDRAGTARLNLLGYCMGGTMSTIFTALQPDRVRNLILMATPIDFGSDEGLLNLWAREDYFDVDKLIDTYGNCPGEFLKFVFQLMKPVQNFAEKQLTIYENLDDAAFLDNFVAVERWANDSIPVVGETFRQYVKALYQQNQLVSGQMSLAGMPVRLDAITCPLLLLVAEKDHLVPPASTLALEKYVSSEDVESMSINAGHVGLAVSSKAHRHLWPEAADWIANHSTEL